MTAKELLDQMAPGGLAETDPGLFVANGRHIIRQALFAKAFAEAVEAAVERTKQADVVDITPKDKIE